MPSKAGWHGLCKMGTLPRRSCVSVSCWLPWIGQVKYFSQIQEGQSLKCLPYLQFQAHSPCTQFSVAMSLNKKEPKVYKLIYQIYCDGVWGGLCLFILFVLVSFFPSITQYITFSEHCRSCRTGHHPFFLVLFRILFLEIEICKMYSQKSYRKGEWLEYR